jgi:hypothetical protein
VPGQNGLLCSGGLPYAICNRTIFSIDHCALRCRWGRVDCFEIVAGDALCASRTPRIAAVSSENARSSIHHRDMIVTADQPLSFR